MVVEAFEEALALSEHFESVFPNSQDSAAARGVLTALLERLVVRQNTNALLSTAEAAELANKDSSTILRWGKSGRIPMLGTRSRPLFPRQAILEQMGATDG